MAAVFQSLSLSSRTSPGFRCHQRLHSPVCWSLPSSLSASCVVAAQAGKVQPFALGLRSSGLPRSGSGKLLLGQKLKIRVSPRVQPLQRMQVFAERGDLFRVLAVAVRIGREALEAGSRLVPEPVPRSVAQAGVALASLVVFSVVLKSVFSTVIFIAAIGGICYAALLYLSRDGSSSSGGSGVARTTGTVRRTAGPLRRTDAAAVEEARRIMDKYR